MKLNADKCHFLLAGYKHEHLWIKVGDSIIWESTSEKLLGALIDRSLKFDTHVLKLCKKVGQKVTILSRLTKYMTLQKRRIVLKSFIESQFSYCPLIWMFHGRITNTKINRIHERALRLIYDDYISTFEELLDKDGSFSIHHRNLQLLAIELYKNKHGESPEIMQNILVNSEYNGANLRCQMDFHRPYKKHVYSGDDSIQALGPKIWNIIPSDIRDAESVDKFKNLIRKWKPTSCPCRLCKVYVQRQGYTNVIENYLDPIRPRL